MKLHVLILLAVTTVPAGTDHFRYERPVAGSPGSTPTDSQSCFSLDADVFAHASPQLADLRLYRGTAETPYVVRVAAPVKPAEVTTSPLNLGVRGKETVFDAAMPEGKYSDVELKVDAQDFLATVTVSGSYAQSTRDATKLGVFTIFDLSSQKLGRSTVLHLPEAGFPYLHFALSGPVSPDKITGLAVLRLPASEPQYSTVGTTSLITSQGKSSLIEFTVPAHVPVNRVVFYPGAQPASFSRDVTVTAIPLQQDAGSEIENASAVSSGNLLRLHRLEDGHRIDEERLSVDAPAVTFAGPARWTIDVKNGDDTPLDLHSVSLEMLERELCFQAASHAQYALFYGDVDLVAPRYDYAALFQSQPSAVHLALGAELPNPTYHPRPDSRPFTERHPALLWAAMIMVIALLAVIAWRSARSQENKPEAF